MRPYLLSNWIHICMTIDDRKKQKRKKEVVIRQADLESLWQLMTGAWERMTGAISLFMEADGDSTKGKKNQLSPHFQEQEIPSAARPCELTFLYCAHINLFWRASVSSHERRGSWRLQTDMFRHQATRTRKRTRKRVNSGTCLTFRKSLLYRSAAVWAVNLDDDR